MIYYNYWIPNKMILIDFFISILLKDTDKNEEIEKYILLFVIFWVGYKNKKGIKIIFHLFAALNVKI